MHERLKVLPWKVVWNLIPTKSAVAERVGASNPDTLLCELCGEGREDLELLLRCPVNRIMWRESPWLLDIVIFSNQPVTEWVKKLLHPHQPLGIPVEDQLNFQLFTAML